jgi:hypothetical protein
MNRDVPFAARIAFRLPQALYDKLEIWADEEDRPLANLIYTVVKQAVTERERTESAHAGEMGEVR